MPVPTHGPRCRTLFCRPSRCGDCGQEVFHWACTCGSHVLFDALGDPWPRHQCTRTKSGKKKVRPGDSAQINVKPRNVYTYGVLSSVCAICGKTVRKRELDAHNYWTHGIGKRPPDPAKRSSDLKHSGKSPISSSTRPEAKKSSTKPTVICNVCKQSVRRNRLEKHMRKAHPGTLSTSAPQVRREISPAGRRLPNGTVPTKPVTECEVCSIPVRLDRFDAHMQRVHPSWAGSNEPWRQR